MGGKVMPYFVISELTDRAAGIVKKMGTAIQGAGPVDKGCHIGNGMYLSLPVQPLPVDKLLPVKAPFGRVAYLAEKGGNRF